MKSLHNYIFWLVPLCILMKANVVRAQILQPKSPQYEQLDSAKVTADKTSHIRGNEYILTMAQTKSTISVLGEPDVIRQISSLPGVSQGMEGTQALFVRGSPNGSNSIIFDGVPMNGSSHLFGIISSIPSGIVENSRFFPGGISSSYGNMSSAIIDIQRINVAREKQRGILSISPYLLGFQSVLSDRNGNIGVGLSARISTLAGLGKAYLNKHPTEFNSSMDGKVFDISALFDWNITDKYSLDALYFKSYDSIAYSEDSFSSTSGWSQSVFKIGFLWKPAPRTSVYSKFWYSSSNSGQKQDMTIISFNKEDYQLSINLKKQINSRVGISSGIEYEITKYQPNNTPYNSTIAAIYTDLVFEESKYMKVQAGGRYHLANNDGHRFNGIDLHILTDLYVRKDYGIELAYDRMSQYKHVLEGLPAGWALDITVPSSKEFPAEITNQFYSGFFYSRTSKVGVLNTSIGGYFKAMSGLVSYKNGVNFLKMNELPWELETDSGKGESRGIEFSAKHEYKWLNSRLSYTLSKTTRKFTYINEGKPFPFKFDRRHILNMHESIVLAKYISNSNHIFSHSVNIAFSYATGHRETFAISTYQGITPPFWETHKGNYTVEFSENIHSRLEMTEMNAFKMKDYIRLDVSYILEKRGYGRSQQLCVSVFNVLNRHNPYLLFNKNGRWKQLSIMPIMPSVRWELKF